jgi:hypothetical protein
MHPNSPIIEYKNYKDEKQIVMKYTREQAESAFIDYRKYHELIDELHESEIEFLNAKFPPIEVGKWYKSINGSLIRATARTIGGLFEGFGFNTDNKWEHSDYWGARFFTPATEQEVLDRLTDHAKNIYKVGDRVRSLFCGNDFVIDGNNSLIMDDYLWFSGIAVLNLSTGKWAEVIESTPKEWEKLHHEITEVVYYIGDEEVKPTSIHEKIEKFERELAELKKLINK